MTNMFQLVLALGCIEALIFYLPAAFRHAEQRACAGPARAISWSTSRPRSGFRQACAGDNRGRARWASAKFPRDRSRWRPRPRRHRWRSESVAWGLAERNAFAQPVTSPEDCLSSVPPRASRDRRKRAKRERSILTIDYQIIGEARPQLGNGSPQ